MVWITKSKCVIVVSQSIYRQNVHMVSRQKVAVHSCIPLHNCGPRTFVMQSSLTVLVHVLRLRSRNGNVLRCWRMHAPCLQYPQATMLCPAQSSPNPVFMSSESVRVQGIIPRGSCEPLSGEVVVTKGLYYCPKTVKGVWWHMSDWPLMRNLLKTLL